MDTTVKKIDSRTSPRGPEGQIYLASGTHLAMRLWREEPGQKKDETVRDYETVGYVLRGSAKLTLEGQTVRLEQGDSWLVPKNARHKYEVLEPFEAIEATAPPSQVHGREEKE